MVGKDKKGDYICLEMRGNKICNGLLWDLNSTIDHENEHTFL